MKIQKQQLEQIKKSILKIFKEIKRKAKKNRKCLRKACGCAILNIKIIDNVSIITTTIATNGPSGEINKCSGIKGNCGCSHSEPRAIIKFLKENLYHLIPNKNKIILLTTFSSCVNCANIIIDSGIIKAVSYEFIASHWAVEPNNAKKILEDNLIHFSKRELIKDKTNKILKKIFNNV